MADRLMGQARRLLPDFSGTGKRTAGGIGIAILVAVLLYYPVGMVITNSIDDDVDYKIADAALPEGGSRAVAMEPFMQIRNQNTINEGTGLGLPLTKKLVEIQGGNLSIKSAPNVGTTVEVYFPKVSMALSA